MQELNVVIEVKVSRMDQVKDLARIANEIRKEYNCNCTLSVKAG